MKNNDHKKVGRAGWSDEDHTERFDVNDYADEIVNSEVSTGKKKSKKKKHKKSDHKHEFVEVILREESVSPFDGKKFYSVFRGEKCKFCSQIKVKGLFVERLNDGSAHSRILKYSEVVKKYPDLEIIDIE